MFKPGDIVICVRPNEAGTLKRNHKYKVLSSKFNKLRLNGVESQWNMSRFINANKRQEYICHNPKNLPHLK